MVRMTLQDEKRNDMVSLRVMRDALQTHFPENFEEIGNIMHNMSEMKVNVTQKTYPIMTSLVAFGDLSKRSLFIMCICRAIQPTVVYSAYIKDIGSREFEVVLLSKKDISMDDFEYFLDLFKMSVCVIPFSRYMGPDMMEGISRIQLKGTHTTGNFHTRQAQTVRRYYQCKRRIKRMEEKKMLVQRVTGLCLTAENIYLSCLYVYCLIVVGRNFFYV
jgi:hypothetical protein